MTTTAPWLTVLGAVVAAVVGRLVGGCSQCARTSVVLVLFGIALRRPRLLLTRPVRWDDWGASCSTCSSPSPGSRCASRSACCWRSGAAREAAAASARLSSPTSSSSAAFRCTCCCSWPSSSSRCSCRVETPTRRPVVRAIVVFTLFTAAYVAEIVRGGLQSLPRGPDGGRPGARPVAGPDHVADRAPAGAAQRDPGARRAVHQPVQGHDAGRLRPSASSSSSGGRAGDRSAEFQGQQLSAETLAFVMLLFWVGCITMSRESQRLERSWEWGRDDRRAHRRRRPCSPTPRRSPAPAT